MRILIFGIILSLSTAHIQQTFRKVPENVTVLEGGNATLQCEVYNKAGTFQWSRAGLMLGFKENIPGFGRRLKYQIQHVLGIFNLVITNSLPEDEGFYECQIGPVKGQHLLRAGAYLTVKEKLKHTQSSVSLNNSQPLVLFNETIKVVEPKYSTVRHFSIGRTSKKFKQHYTELTTKDESNIFVNKIDSEYWPKLFIILGLLGFSILFVIACLPRCGHGQPIHDDESLSSVNSKIEDAD